MPAETGLQDLRLMHASHVVNSTDSEGVEMMQITKGDLYSQNQRHIDAGQRTV